MKEQELLVSLGVKKSDAQIYLSLLKNGPSSIRKLATLTNINRGSVYEALKRLMATGLVNFQRKGTNKKFVAENPEKIYEIIEEKKAALNHTENSAQEIIPALMAQNLRLEGEPVVKFYEDDEGITSILRDVISTVSKLDNKEYYVYSSRPIRQFLYRRFPNFTRRRIKENIFVKVIAIGEGGEHPELAQRKWLPEHSQEEPSSYNIIYGNKVALISVSGDETPFGVIIEEPGVTIMQKYLFETLWNKLN